MMPSVGSMISASTKAYEHAKTRQNGQLRGDQKAMSQMHDQIRALAKGPRLGPRPGTRRPAGRLMPRPLKIVQLGLEDTVAQARREGRTHHEAVAPLATNSCSTRVSRDVG